MLIGIAVAQAIHWNTLRALEAEIRRKALLASIWAPQAR
jgi:hypothetical protein